MITKHKVYVALSGGVDSAVAANILLEEGFHVIGIFMETWRDPHNSTAIEELSKTKKLAAQVAESIGIPFITLDLRETFYQKVIQSFIKQYTNSFTPNPCLFCNPQVKWGILQTVAFEHGAHYFSTGHYARILRNDDEQVQLARGIDRMKDQSYVLAMLSQKQLSRTLLPLGDLTKNEVRKIAQENNLFVFDREESQDLCFLQGENYRNFLHRFAPESVNKGEIINMEGDIIGEHEGLPFYTIGQRKGIKIAAAEPYYVIRKEPKNNRLVVGFFSQARSKFLHAVNVNWIGQVPPKAEEKYQVMIRYRAKPISAELTYLSLDEFRLEFSEPQQGVTPGQVAVIYHDEICLGGGMINAVD